MAIYVTVTQLKADPAVKDIFPKSWGDDQYNSAITEAEAYIESRIFPLGYQRGQLVTVPATDPPTILAQKMFNLVMNYLRYVLMRDIYSNNAPQEGTGERYEKYKENVDAELEQFEKHALFFYNSSGTIIKPATPDSRYKVGSNTTQATRMITMDKREQTWSNDGTNSDESVIGLKS